jgi:hypothetical protein
MTASDDGVFSGPAKAELRQNQAWLPCILIIVAACLLVYGHTVRMDFVYDDISLLKEPSLIWNSDILATAFGDQSMAALGKQTPYYRPLLFTSLALDHRFWGTNPAGFHATNVLCHSLAAVLVFLVARRLFVNRWTATASALLFALHPVQAEAVTWITGRSDIVCAIFFLASFLAYQEYMAREGVMALVLSLALFLCALLSKEMALTLPLLVVMYQFRTVESRVRPWTPLLFALPLAIYLWQRFAHLTSQTLDATPLFWRFCTGVGLVARYLAHLLLPVNLRVFYDLPVQKSLTQGGVLLPLLVVTVVLAGTWYLFMRRQLAGFGLAWILVTLLPVSGLLALLQPSLMADRYLYIPAVGLGIAAGSVAERCTPYGKNAVVGVSAMLLAILGGASFSRTFSWKDQPAYIRQVVHDAPQSYFGWYFRGIIFQEEGRFAEAMTAFSRALEINRDLSEAHFARGLLYAQGGALPEAEGEFRAVLRQDPSSWKAYTNFGVILARQGRYGEAITAFRQALQLNPLDEVARDNLQRALALMPGGIQR